MSPLGIWTAVLIAIILVYYGFRVLTSICHAHQKRLIMSDQIEDRLVCSLIVLGFAMLTISFFFAKGGDATLEQTATGEYLLKRHGRYRVVSRELWNFIAAVQKLGMAAWIILGFGLLLRRGRLVFGEVASGVIKTKDAMKR